MCDLPADSCALRDAGRSPPASVDGSGDVSAIARELASSPPLLCLDDALLGLSPDDREVLLDVLRSEGASEPCCTRRWLLLLPILSLAGVFSSARWPAAALPAATSESEPALP